jgi:hypothetical protein
LNEKYETLRKEYNKDVDVVKKMEKFDPTISNYARYSASLSNSSYWASGVELFARAFESHIETKLKSKGRESTYLVDGTDVKYPTGVKMPDGSEGQPYPHGEERKNISAKMEKLMTVLRDTGALKKAFNSVLDLLKAQETAA